MQMSKMVVAALVSCCVLWGCGGPLNDETAGDEADAAPTLAPESAASRSREPTDGPRTSGKSDTPAGYGFTQCSSGDGLQECGCAVRACYSNWRECWCG